MARTCSISGKGPMSGNKRSHALNATRRKWNVNLQKKTIVVNGKKIIGCIGESCINGNRIFIPAAGWEYDHVPNNHMWVWYWTRDLSKGTNNRAMQMIFDEENNMLETGKDSGRSNGMPIRAVVKNK